MRSVLITLFLSTFFLGMNAQGIEFYDGNYKDALKMADEKGKLVFVDAYAVWCGPCKKMAATTFKEAAVGDFFNENFINLKIDMEKGQGLDFRNKYPVSAYPTLLFLNGDGDVVHKAVGGKDSNALLQLAQMAMRKDDRSGKFAEKYEEGNRDYDLVLNYIKALNKVDKPSLKIANDYVRSAPKISKEQMAIFLYEATVQADSRLFTKMIEHRSLLETKLGKEAVLEKIEKACDNTVATAIEFEDPDLVKEAKGIMKKHARSKSKVFATKADMEYYKGIGELDVYFKMADDYVSKIIKNDADQLHKIAQSLSKEYKSNKAALKIAEKSCGKCVKLNDDINYKITFAQILNQNDKKGEALKIAKQALEQAKEAGKPTRNIEGMIRYFESD